MILQISQDRNVERILNYNIELDPDDPEMNKLLYHLLSFNRYKKIELAYNIDLKIIAILSNRTRRPLFNLS